MHAVVVGHQVSLYPGRSTLWWVFSTIVIRLIMSAARAGQSDKRVVDGFGRTWWNDLRSLDHLVRFLVGTIELAIYPILIWLGSWQSITAWLGIKTATGWRWQPNQDRQDYTSFLLGDALVIFGSFLLTPLIEVK
jgi:hypothetical protein